MREMATVRTNILLTPTEHRRWTKRARDGGVSLAEYIRRSLTAAESGPTAEELAELEALAAELTAASETMHRLVDEALAEVRAGNDPAWEIAARERIAAELASDPIEFDPTVFNFSQAR